MSVRLTASVGSLDGLVANLFVADQRMQEGVRRVVLRNGERQFDLTRKYAPVKSGRLRRLTRLRISDDGLVARVGYLTRDFREEGVAPYFTFVWHGTRFMAANPFPERARNEVFPVFKAELADEVRQAVRRRR